MSKIYRQREVVEAMYVTDDTFDAPHPNEDHMTGIMFYPQTRTVELTHPCDDDEKVAEVGDVIVRHGKDGTNAWDSIWKPEAFENTFEEVHESVRLDSVLESIEELREGTNDSPSLYWFGQIIQHVKGLPRTPFHRLPEHDIYLSEGAPHD